MGQPVYELNVPFCYVRAFSSSVNFGFWRGATLSRPGLKRGQAHGTPQARPTEDVDAPAFRALVREAIELNEKLGDPTLIDRHPRGRRGRIGENWCVRSLRNTCAPARILLKQTLMAQMRRSYKRTDLNPTFAR